MTASDNDQQKLKQMIGAAIRDARLARGVTQEDLARTFGVDRVTIARYESGVRTISAPTFLQMLAFLGREIPLGAAPASPEKHGLPHTGRLDPTTERIVHLLQERPDLAATVKELLETLEVWPGD